MDLFSCCWTTASTIISCIGAVKYVDIQRFTRWKCCFTICWKKYKLLLQTQQKVQAHKDFACLCVYFSAPVCSPPAEPSVLWWISVYTVHAHLSWMVELKTCYCFDGWEIQKSCHVSHMLELRLSVLQTAFFEAVLINVFILTIYKPQRIITRLCRSTQLCR